MEQYKDITELLLKYLRQELTTEESATLTAWTGQSQYNQQLFQEINDTPALMADVKAWAELKDRIDVHAAWQRWQASNKAPAPVIRLPWWRSAVAVALLLIIGTAVVYFYRQAGPQPTVPVVVKEAQRDAAPAISKAYLTLDNGQRIVLDSANGLLATEGDTKVEMGKNGKLSYTGGKGANEKMIYNTVTVPKGSDVVYLQLSDGSRLWLNAESSVRYPVAFNEAERKIEIKGEAFFDITHSGKKFIVSKGKISVEVLGTKFNVNTYENEDNIKVTLLEGSVRVQSDKAEQIIKPGQQAVVSDAKIKVLNDVDLGQVVAWKEGKFIFSRSNIQGIMRQMERWYDLEPTRYENEAVKEWEFNGEISRYNAASKVLQLLEKTGSVKFTIEGKKILVRPL